MVAGTTAAAAVVVMGVLMLPVRIMVVVMIVATVVVVIVVVEERVGDPIGFAVGAPGRDRVGGLKEDATREAHGAERQESGEGVHGG
jgi:hypothetical protein